VTRRRAACSSMHLATSRVVFGLLLRLFPIFFSHHNLATAAVRGSRDKCGLWLEPGQRTRSQHRRHDGPAR